MDSQERKDCSKDTNISGNLLKFLLKRGGWVSSLGLGKNLTKSAQISDHTCDHSAFTTLATGTREHNWRWEGVALLFGCVIGVLGRLVLFFISELAAN